MGLALFKERRLAERRKLTGLLPGRLMVKDTKADILCRPVDVSPSGMGIVAHGQLEAFQPGTEIVLLVQNQPVRLQVAWSQRDFGKQDLFRYGLVTVAPEVDLVRLFVEAGCLR